MKKITLLLIAIFSLTLVSNSYSQVFWTDSFDTTAPTSGVRSAPNHANTTDGSGPSVCGSGDYFFRTNISSDPGNGLSEVFTEYSGYYWRGEDLDGCFSNPDIINFTGIDISGRSNLVFKGLFGAREDIAFEATDNLIVEYSIDGSPYVTGIAFESDFVNVSVGRLAEDTNLDGTGDGATLTLTLTEYDFSIVGTGTTLSLRITATSNSSGEEFAFDTFTVESSVPTTPPTVTTTAASSVNTSGATLAGNVTANGGATVTERGIVYSETATNSNPQISGSGVTKDTNGSGTGAFSEAITGLSPGTQYSFAAYAINSEGTSYGTVQTFTTSSLIAPTITFANIPKTYGDADFNLLATSNSSGTISYSIEGTNTTGTSLSGTNNTTVDLGNTGSVTIRATQAADGSYSSGTKDITLTIASKALTVTADAKTKVYGATDPSLTYTITGFVNSESESDLDTGVSIARATGEDVGTYTITLSAAADTNYSVTFATADFSITQAALTVTADARTKVYGATDPSLTYSISGFVNSESDLDTGVSIVRATGEDVGTYTITPSAAADANYSVTFATADFSITQAALTVTADAGQMKMYGEADPTLTYQITSGSLETGDVLTGNLSRVTGEDVGEYAISSTLENTNYNITFVSANFSIQLREIMVNADAKFKVYGEPDPELTYQITIGTLVNGDMFTGTLMREPGEEVGLYHILEGTLQLPNNYQLIYAGADFTITDNTASVEDISITKAITVYPNPASETLFIKLDIGLEIKAIEVYNTIGKKVQYIQGNLSSIDLRGLSKGFYFIKVMTNEGTAIKKILKE